MAEIQVLDTSALGRAFAEGPDQGWLTSLVESGRAHMCLLGLAEARVIVSTHVRRGMPVEAANELWGRVAQALSRMRFTDLVREDFQHAQDLMASDAALRGGDAIHVANAHRLSQAGVGVTFVTADRRQAAVAERLVDEVRLLV